MIEAVSCHVGRHGTTRTPLPRRLDERRATVSKEAYGAFVGIAHIGWIRSHFESFADVRAGVADESG